MIKRTLLFFVLFLVVYGTIATITQWPSKSLTQWENNDRTIENFLYAPNQAQITTIITGSSMAFRMGIDQNPYRDTVFNLALGGQGIYEGFEVIKRSGYHPKRILVESNVLYKGARDNYTSSFFMPGLYQMRKKITGLQQQYKPITFAQYLYYGVRGKIISLGKNNKEQQTSEIASIINDTILGNPVTEKLLLEKHLARVEANNRNILKEINWENATTELKQYLDFFKRNNVEILFFEMPSEAYILDGDLNQLIRQVITQNYNEYPYILASPKKTTDGLHLSPDDAKAYLPELLDIISEYPSSITSQQ